MEEHPNAKAFKCFIKQESILSSTGKSHLPGLARFILGLPGE